MILVCVCLMLSVCMVDLVIKHRIDSKVQAGETREMCDGNVEIRKVHNKGMMLNLMDKHPEHVRTLSLLTLIGVFVYHMLLFRKPGLLKEKLGTALILGGAISNTYDRVKKGYVVDYIGFKCKWKKLAKITYNIGDFALFIGTILVIIENMLKK